MKKEDIKAKNFFRFRVDFISLTSAWKREHSEEEKEKLASTLEKLVKKFNNVEIDSYKWEIKRIFVKDTNIPIFSAVHSLRTIISASSFEAINDLLFKLFDILNEKDSRSDDNARANFAVSWFSKET